MSRNQSTVSGPVSPAAGSVPAARFNPDGGYLLVESYSSASGGLSVGAQQEDGGYYEIGYATNPGGLFTVHGTTSSKNASGYTVDDLPSDPPAYFLVVRTYTPPHDAQQNHLWSDYSPTVVAGSTRFVLAELGPGDVIGEVSALAGGDRVATVTASADVSANEDGELLPDTPER